MRGGTGGSQGVRHRHDQGCDRRVHTGGLLAREKGDSRQDMGRGRHDVGFGQTQVRYIGFLGYFTLWRGSNYTSVLVV